MKKLFQCSECGKTFYPKSSGPDRSIECPSCHVLLQLPDDEGLSVDDASKQGSLQLASLTSRIVAFGIDTIPLVLLLIPVSLFLGLVFTLAPESSEESYGRITLVVEVVVFALYFSVTESSSKQGTFGKRARGIKVVDLQGRRIGFTRACVRGLVKAVALGPLSFMIACFTTRKQALHDLCAETLVVKVDRPANVDGG